MIVLLPDPAAATVRKSGANEATVTVHFAVRDAAQRDALVALLEYAQEGGFAVELRLLHYRGRSARVK